MEITGTLTKLGQYISEWHTKKYDALHSKQLEKNTQLETKIKESDGNAYATEIAKYISKKIDGQVTIKDDFEDILNEINDKDNQDIYLNKLYNDLNNTIEKISALESMSDDVEYLKNNNLSDVNINNKIDEAFQGKNNIINTGDNLNNYKKAGIYRCNFSSISITLDNNPTQSTFSLIVLEYDKDTNASIHQILYDNKNEIWIRTYDSYITQSWTNWKKLYGEHNTQTLNMEVQFSDNSTATYTILIKEV